MNDIIDLSKLDFINSDAENVIKINRYALTSNEKYTVTYGAYSIGTKIEKNDAIFGHIFKYELPQKTCVNA